MAKVDYTLRARIINALEGLPDGYSFVSTIPFQPVEEWIKSQPAAKQEAAMIFIENIAKSKPNLIGGSGWREEAERRLAALDATASQSKGAPGMTGKEVSAKVAADKAASAKKMNAEAKAQREAGAGGAAKKESAVAEAFVGSGKVRVDEEENWGDAPPDASS